MNYSLSLLPSGLRLLRLPSPSAVAYVGIAVAAGSRDELPGEEGLAHLCEHLAFKGTARRSALQTVNAIERLGGSLDAYTTKETTVFYAVVQRRHIRQAMDVLEDIVFHSQCPEAQVEKEREVVCDEIESYNDSPAELIWDDFDNIIFEGHPLGHNILGTAEQVRAYTGDDARRFRERLYRPERAVMFCLGGEVAPAGQTIVPRDGGASDLPDKSGKSNKSAPREIVLHRDTHQAHVVIGRRAYSSTDARRTALQLLNNVLGGPALSARLNLALRERGALVYAVESSMVCYRDTGSWAVYFGCDSEDVRHCLRLARHQIERVCRQGLTPAALRAAKRQLTGQIAIATANPENVALDMARLYLHTGRLYDPQEQIARIEALTQRDIAAAAADIFDTDSLTTLIYG